MWLTYKIWLVLKTPIFIVIISPEFPLFGDKVNTSKKKNKVKQASHQKLIRGSFLISHQLASLSHLAPESSCSDGLFKHSSKHGAFSLKYFKVFPVSRVRLFIKQRNQLWHGRNYDFTCLSTMSHPLLTLTPQVV